jgi:hypothetical protein
MAALFTIARRVFLNPRVKVALAYPHNPSDSHNWQRVFVAKFPEGATRHLQSGTRLLQSQ